ncbi:zincin-like metallopeptidase domain-containing protein [Bacteroides sp.]|jgi:hypothetical protein|uniref:ArdC family protein n=1 Tax=Bacteroides sp. TaxID=29523 RepID=UPI0026016CE1|nr:zincin-like metallopeptidase domain-containing protein [Bacteroides sp.]MDD3038063.1 zincin-like metallopeptidase domain-containing protein [Bacteroides sp.]
MATNKRKNYAPTDGRSAEDRALDRFAEMMIEKIKSIHADWKKPWFTEGALQWPRNLSGREYNGMNALMLMLHCEKEGYQIPVFMTFERVTSLNNAKGKDGVRKPLTDKEGNLLPQVSVLKGAKSFPVFLTTFTVIHEETKRKISYDDYKKLSLGEQQEYKVYPKLQVYNVFNADQTNMQEARPELYEKLKATNVALPPELTATGYCFPAMDELIRNNEWLCPIHLKHQDKAYYSLKSDEIVLPEKEQFYEGESFYGTAFHEMIHSTGAESRLKRFEPGSYFGSPGYAREELVAELGSALVMQKHGLTKTVKEESCAYLKNWLAALAESPEFIKSILTDVKRSTAMVGEKIETINMRLKTASTENQQVHLLPITSIPSDVTTEIHLTDKEACDAVQKILVDYMRGEPVRIEVNKNGDHVVRIEGNCIDDAMEMLTVGLDAETYDKITKASCYLKGYPVERYRDVFVDKFTDEFEKKRNDPAWLKKQGLEGKVNWEVCLPGSDEYYVVKAFAQGKCMVGALDYKCNTVLPFVELADEKRLEDTLGYFAEIRRRLLSVNENVDPFGRISFNGSPVEDPISKSVSRDILIDGEARAVFVSKPDDKYDLNFTLDLGNSSVAKGLADYSLGSVQRDREKGTSRVAVNSLNELYYWKDQAYAPRVIDEQTNMNVYDYVGMQLPKRYEATDDEVVNEREEEVEHEERMHTGMRR